MDILIFSAEEQTIFWGRKKPSNLKGIGWNTDFWIYIMIYVMLMSLAAGFFHSHFTEKVDDQSVILKLPAVLEPQQFEILEKRNKKTNLRKTTF